METMHLTARLLIEQNMQHMTAFSARPDAPVLPASNPRWTPVRALRRFGRRLRGRVVTTRPVIGRRATV